MALRITPKNVHEIVGRSILADGFDFVLDFEKSHGSYLYDSRTKKKYLDLFSFFASLPLGFNHPQFKKKDYLRKLLRVSIIKPSNSDIYTIEYAEFLDTFHRVVIRDLFKHLFFIDGGALAVENAMKVAFDWKIRKNFARGMKHEVGNQIIHFKEAFHGRSGYTLSVTNTFDPNKIKHFPKFSWPRISNPKCIFPLEGENLQMTIAAEKAAISEIKQVIENQCSDIAAILIEPIQGEGGDNHFRPEFLQELRKICDQNEILLIFDEVQCGMGLTGKWWAFEWLEVKPDILVFGKKSQVCGIAATSRVDEVDSVFKVSSRINSTFGGNLTDMVRCTQYLRIIQNEHLLKYVCKTGAWLKAELEKISQELPEVTNVRGVGFMVAFDLPDSTHRDALKRRCFDSGVIILPCGERSLRLRPSLNIPKADLKKALEIVRSNIVQHRYRGEETNGIASKRRA